MRQGQHKNRQRGRGQRRPGSGGGGGGGNSSNRVYESNGPEVKVRGTAQTVADKYLQFARDSISSGDYVMAESYYQHAEHYLRIIAANQSHQQQQQQQQQQRQAAAEAAGEENVVENGSATEVTTAPGSGPQPSLSEEKPEEKSPDTNASNDGFDGQTPGFLAKPASTAAVDETEKPKRTRRAPARSRSTKSSTAGKDDAVSPEVSEPPAEPSAEPAAESSADAEAAAN